MAGVKKINKKQIKYLDVYKRYSHNIKLKSISKNPKLASTYFEENKEFSELSFNYSRKTHHQRSINRSSNKIKEQLKSLKINYIKESIQPYIPRPSSIDYADFKQLGLKSKPRKPNCKTSSLDLSRNQKIRLNQSLIYEPNSTGFMDKGRNRQTKIFKKWDQVTKRGGSVNSSIDSTHLIDRKVQSMLDNYDHNKVTPIQNQKKRYTAKLDYKPFKVIKDSRFRKLYPDSCPTSPKRKISFRNKSKITAFKQFDYILDYLKGNMKDRDMEILLSDNFS